MSKFDDMIDWLSGYTRAVNDRKALELKEREVKALERLAVIHPRIDELPPMLEQKK